MKVSKKKRSAAAKNNWKEKKNKKKYNAETARRNLLLANEAKNAGNANPRPILKPLTKQQQIENLEQRVIGLEAIQKELDKKNKGLKAENEQLAKTINKLENTISRNEAPILRRSKSRDTPNRISVEREVGEEERVLTSQEVPEFGIFQVKMVEQLIQHCPDCGAVPGRSKPTDRPREITWTSVGSCLIAKWHCSCIKSSKKSHSWAGQDTIGTYYAGNICLVGSARLSPIEFVDISQFFKTADMPFMGKTTFLQISNKFVGPAIDSFYENQLPVCDEKADFVLDGTYDSPGHNASYLAETLLDRNSQLIVDVEIVQKQETDNVSNRMELLAVQRLVDKISAEKINTATIDKHLQIVKFFKSRQIKFFYDPWHHLKSFRRKIRSSRQLMLDKNKQIEQKQLESYDQLSKRLIKHIYFCVEESDRTKMPIKELVLSFFLHVCGLHEWEANNVGTLVYSLGKTKDWNNAGFDPRKIKKIKKFHPFTERFQQCQKCCHDVAQEFITGPIYPVCKPFIELYKIATTTTFLEDLCHLKSGRATSIVESFHNVSIKFRPKRRYYTRYGFRLRTRLAIISFNENIRAEKRGDRKIIGEYTYFSRSKQDTTTKKKKNVYDGWKREILEIVYEKVLHPQNMLNFDQDDENDGDDLIFDNEDEDEENNNLEKDYNEEDYDEEDFEEEDDSDGERRSPFPPRQPHPYGRLQFPSDSDEDEEEEENEHKEEESENDME